MFHHVAMFRFKDGTTAEQVSAVDTALAALPDQIDVLAGYRFGPDAGVTEGSWDYIVIADLADASDFPAYRNHPAHAAAVADVISPIVAESARVQFET
jgi:hypothetical protein